MKKKVIRFLKKIRKNLSHYLSTNRLYINYVLFCLIETVLLRKFTINNALDYKPFICDLALLIIIGSLGYFVKPKKQFNYYFIWMLIITLMCVVNSVYYTFYTSFASFGLIASISQMETVGDSVIEKFKIVDFIYIIFPILFYMLHSKLKRGNYYHFVSKVEKAKKMFTATALIGVIVLAFTLVNITGTDASRLVKQWNREYLVQRFGLILYQGNDLFQSLTPKINSLFGYDEAAKNFKEFYTNKWSKNSEKKNQYTNVLEGMNIVFVHMESIQNYLVDMKVNNTEITPTLNKLTKEGMYFDNFYPQISVGTSSDTEFTLNTSLMPALSGTVFVSYYNRDYVSIPKLLKEKGYYTFSAHANNASMWNRSAMHPSLGYDEMIFKDQFDVTPENSVGLGLSDVEFFKQLQTKLEKIEDEHDNYMGTLIQLSNHSPFADTDINPNLYESFGKLDLTNQVNKINEKTGIEEPVVEDYLQGTKLGNYLISAHYGDMSLGTFIDYINNSDHYNNTVFVFYGDHDARLDKSEYQYYYNYDITTGKLLTEEDPGYIDYDNISHELNKNTPLVIWTKNDSIRKKIKSVNHNVMGMYDLMPTIGNMIGIKNKYALGNDIYDIKDNNIVVFPSGNFMTNKIYYNNTSGNYRILTQTTKNGKLQGTIDLEDNYIDSLKNYTEEILNVSNDIIVHDLIAKEGEHIEDKKGGSENG